MSTTTFGGAPRASQLSGSTAFSSAASLTSLGSANTVVSQPAAATPSAPPAAGGPVMATANIINQKADASRSLYQICVSLKVRLAQVSGFDAYLQQLAVWEADPNLDGVEALWQLLRTGRPLLMLYNTLQPEKPIQVPEDMPAEKAAKLSTLKFVQACKDELDLPGEICFIISDLLGSDTTGFVKVTGAVNYVLDLAQQRGLLLQQAACSEDAPAGPGSQMSYRDHIVRELVDTERKYVQDLENLYDLKKTLEVRGVIPGDAVHAIFLNINAILDFQRRFLIRVETTNSQPKHVQAWGSPFVLHEESFGIYQPFIANQRKAAHVAGLVFDKIRLAEHPVAVDFNTLDGFLLKPMQRLVKYPLLLKDLLKQSDDPDTKEDLALGIAAAERVLTRANEAVDRDMLDEAVEELITRVDDWKNHVVKQFGRLILHGVYTVVTGKSDQEKDYEIYLFESILLCCKEMLSTRRDKDKKDKTRSTGPKMKNKNAKLQLKGRIFMTNVTEVLSFSKPGSYSVQIWWKGDPGVENFVIKFQNEETMKKWAAGLDLQRKTNAPSAQSPEERPANFAWMTNQMANIENPYAQQDEDDDEDDNYQPTPPGTSYGGGPTDNTAGTMPRNSSTTSLTTSMRQRSATAESTSSLASMARAPPPRFPLPTPPAPLSVQTQVVGGPTLPSPGQRGGDSYFSPGGAESPASSRTSATSGIFPPGSAGYPSFPKTGTPQPGWDPDNQRYTAPAMPRAPSRDGAWPANAYGMVNGKNPRGPSLPPMPANPSAAQQQRNRSYSTPDINGQPTNMRRNTAGQIQPGPGVPEVPGIPAHLHYYPGHPTHERYNSSVPRSQTGSPALRNGSISELPIRANTNSPGMQRQRQQSQDAGTGGGMMGPFPAAPIYPRGNAPPGPAGGMPQGLALAPINLSGGNAFGGADGRPTSPPPLGTGTLADAPPHAAATSNGTGALSQSDFPMPTQLKVKVSCDSGNYVTLVVAFNITYQSLIDRIDAKLNRFTSSSIAKGNLRLRYRDEDGDFVSIESDDDIQIAFLEWLEGMRNSGNGGGYAGGVGEIDLFCVGETG